MKSVPEALSEILQTISSLGSERVMLLDAPGRVLAETVVSARPIPPRDNSAMDGYALRAADTAGASEQNPRRLRLTQEVFAGMLPQGPVGPGEAARIATGAPLPQGADAVVRQERARAAGEAEVDILDPASVAQDVRFAAEDVAMGEEVLGPGRVLGPPQVGLLALLGRSVVEVVRRPQVAILSSGDELVGIDGDPEGWKTVDSNAYQTAAQVREAGGVARILPIAPDERPAIARILAGARSADVVISTAGVSVGPRDFVRAALEDVGFSLTFWRVRQRPGSPFAFGTWERRPVFGLPGNPVSAAVCFELYVRPALEKMQGKERLFRPIVRARLDGEVRTRPSHSYFLRALLSREGGQWRVSPAGLQSSAATKALAQGNALIAVPEGAPTPRPGQEVAVIVFGPGPLAMAEGEIARALGFDG